MKMKKIDKYLSIVIIIFSIFLIFMFITTNKEKYKAKNIQLIKMKREIENYNREIFSIDEQISKKENILSTKIEEIKILKNKIDDNKCININEFKKIIYSLTEIAKIDLKQITKEQNIKFFLDYKLVNVNIELNGNLLSLGKFLYYMDKLERYIDTGRFYMKLNEKSFVIGISYLTKDIL